ncbi:hypothetical protein KPH14_001988 [Odynerus spinipes]|uniref:PBZ-type domain-containing protein n=1 Tax=Odynerus spinipes TaxID=1348599 RepID=A0AAD9VXB6_9HYME|nr:hypothetical protein KPH14_001988 [Odynerus spinipes]
MKKLQIVRIANDRVQKANLHVGNNIISCDSSTGICKQKIIKNAVTINLSPSGDMTLTPCQVSPCYVKPTGSSRWQLLKIGTTIPVKPGDICSLLSNKCWFKIMTMPDTMEKDDHLLKRKCTEELASEPPDKRICLDTSPKLITSHGDSSNEFQDNKDSKPVNAEKIVPNNGDSIDASTFSKDISPSLLKIKQSSPSSTSLIESPNLLEDPTLTGQKNSSIKKVDAGDNEINIKQDRAMHFSDNGKSHASTEQNKLPSSVTKSNEASVSNSAQVANRRNKCIYADKCYRKNPCHKVQFSHPGDSDFEIIDERPECPYGVHCYRKNFQHKVQFKHSTVRKRAPTPVRSRNVADEFIDELSSDEESVDESDYEPSSWSSEDTDTDLEEAESD